MHAERRLIAVMTALVALATAACGDERPATGDVPDEAAAFAWPADTGTSAILHIQNLGQVEIALYPSIAPKTVENFVKLAREGFYDGTTFHRVMPNFMVQGGDPNTRDEYPDNDGMGGPGYNIDDEFNDSPHARGTVSMANYNRRNTGGSQFFILLGDSPHLTGKHTAFGQVLSGMDVVDAITRVERDDYGRWGPKYRPIENVVLEKVEIREATPAG